MFEVKAIGSKINNTITTSSAYLNPLVEKPTEEWSGGEIRTYDNYIRPVRNLFENDKELKAFIKATTRGILKEDIENTVLQGCTLTKVNGKYEMSTGVFTNDNKLYHLYPNLKVAEKLLEKEFNKGSNAGTYTYIYITYNNRTYTLVKTTNGVSETNTYDSVISLMNNLGILSNYNNYGLMPVFDSLTNVYYDKSTGKITEGIGSNEDTQLLTAGVSNEWTGLKTTSVKDNAITNAKIADTTNLKFVKGSKATSYDASVSGSNISSTNNEIVDLSQNDLRNILQCVTLNTNQNINGSKTFLQDVTVSGHDIYANNCYSTSSRKFKKDISTYEGDALDVLNKVEVVNYHYKSDEEGKDDKVGFIAEDTPSILSTINMNRMDMTNCIGLLIKAVQELSADNKLLKEKLNDIES